MFTKTRAAPALGANHLHLHFIFSFASFSELAYQVAMLVHPLRPPSHEPACLSPPKRNSFPPPGLSGHLFCPPTDRYRLFGQKVYPCWPRSARRWESLLLSGTNGRVAVEPVLLLGVSLLQYPGGDSGSSKPVGPASTITHAGWNFRPSIDRWEDELFHPSTLVNFRQTACWIMT